MNADNISNISEEQMDNKTAEVDFQPFEPQTRVYVICDKSDLENVDKVEERVLEAGCGLFSSRDYLENVSENDSIETHNKHLAACDAVLIYWNKAPITWVKKNISDLPRIESVRKQLEKEPFRAQIVFCEGESELKTALHKSSEIPVINDYAELSDSLSKISVEEIKPYPGLRPFEYTENYLFFGREGKAQEIAERLEKNRFIAVVGTSGSGKSSVVRAGLLPLLYGGALYESGSHWRIAMMRPEETPIRNLAKSLIYPVDFEAGENDSKQKDETQIGITEAVLRRSGVGLLDFVNNPANNFAKDEKLLIVVDQFEELFRFKEKFSTEYSEEAAAFVKLLLEGTRDEQKRIFVIITMRSDFLGDCAQFNDLPEAINDGQYLIPQMTRDQLRQSIESPALVGDSEVSTALVNRLLNDLEADENQPFDVRERMVRDRLPVLQHALMRTWDLWKEKGELDKPIDIKHYEDKKIGGMAHALSRHADEAYNKLTDEQKIIAEKMFKCLTETDNENREIRRPTKIEEICTIINAKKEEIFEIVEVFREEGRTFLMPPHNVPLKEETKIDISHESLIRNWEMLKGWVKKEAADAWLYRRISEDAYLYFNEYDEDPGSLWSGRALELALQWREDFVPTVDWASRYQPLNKEEKSELYKLGMTDPAQESARRQEIIDCRFMEAMDFLDASAKSEEDVRDAKEKLLKIEASERFNRILRWTVVGLSILLIATASLAVVAISQRAQLEDIQKKLQEQNKTLEKSGAETEEALERATLEKGRADEQADKAKESEKEAKESEKEAKAAQSLTAIEAKKAKDAEAKARTEEGKTKSINKTLESTVTQLGSANSDLEKSRSILDMTLQGTISAAANDYDNSMRNFLLVANSQPCQNLNDDKCKKIYALNRWWAYHNIATANSHLGEFDDAKDYFKKALEVIDDYENKKNINLFKPTQNDFVNVSYNQQTESVDEILKKGKIITLRVFAQFYRNCAVSVNKCNKNNTAVGHSDPSETDDGDEIYGEEKVLSPEEIKLNGEAVKLYGDLLNIERIKNPAIDKDKLYKADVQKELADIYTDLEKYGLAKENYKAALDYYETIPAKSSENLLLMKTLLKVTLYYVIQEPDLEKKNLVEAEKLTDDILIKTQKLSPEIKSDDDILYSKDIGNAYRSLAYIYAGEDILYKALRKRIKEMKSQSAEGEKFMEILTSVQDTLALTESAEDIENLTPEQKRLYAELAADVNLSDEMTQKSEYLSDVSTNIDYLNSKDKYFTEFEILTRLASAYVANNENCKATQMIVKLESAAKQDSVPSVETQKNDIYKTETRNIQLVKLLQLAKFYDSTMNDFDKAAEYYEIWANTFRTKFPDNSNSAIGGEFVSNYKTAGEYYSKHHKYPEARKMFTEYLTYLEKNEENFKGKEDSFNGQALLKRVQLNILIGQSYESEKKFPEAAKLYDKALTDVQNWIQNHKPLARPPSTSVTPYTANVNAVNSNISQTNANANVANSNINSASSDVNRLNSNLASNKTVTPNYSLSEYYANIDSNVEASGYEGYLLVRLADLDINNNQVEKALGRLINEKFRIPFSNKDGVKLFEPFIFKGYVTGLRNAGLKQTNAEQAAIYYQAASEALEYLKYRKASYSDMNYLRVVSEVSYIKLVAMTKEFYEDYIDTLENLARVKGANDELNKKIESAKKDMANLSVSPINAKERVVCKKSAETSQNPR